MNLVKQLGKVAFGTRLRLLTDRFLQEGAKVYKLQNINFEPRWFTLYYLLSKRSPLSISEITNELGYSQPAVTQIANIMVKKGIIKVVKDKTDTRKRMLALSPKGAALLPKLKPIWKGFEDAIDELFSSVGYDVLSIIEKIENELTQKDMLQRVTEKIRQDSADGVTIFIYCDNYKDSFRKLNYEWLEKYFKVEEEDKKLLLNPMEEIIDKGGEVFFARINGDIVGTAALIKYDDKTYELAKMAVTEKAQGRQIGKKLAEAVITQAKANNADVLFLESNTKLTQAMGLYKKLGFKQVEYNNVSKYARSTIKMELKLK
jgi:DNA-binding MarR family transcriptional regulator/N-acetylglutamate synthase-like GNAT family acetyltransferase